MQERSPIPEVFYFTEQEGQKDGLFVFQGQGTQKVDMGRDLCEAHPEVAKLYSDASFVLRSVLNPGWGRNNGNEIINPRSLLDLTADELKRTDFAQVAIFVHSEACRIICEKERIAEGKGPLNPKFYAGNSLGQINAIYAAGGFGNPREFKSLESALRLVWVRGSGMQKACERYSGGLRVVLGDNSKLEEIKKFIKDRKRAIKIYLEADLEDEQIVIAGLNEDLEKAEVLFKEKFGDEIAIKTLDVAGPFHTDYMKEDTIPNYKKTIKRLMKTGRLQNLAVEVIKNTDAKPMKHRFEVERELIRHVTMPVLWRGSLDYAQEKEATGLFEIGKTRLLSNASKHRGLLFKAGAVGALGLAGYVLFQRTRK